MSVEQIVDDSLLSPTLPTKKKSSALILTAPPLTQREKLRNKQRQRRKKKKRGVVAMMSSVFSTRRESSVMNPALPNLGLTPSQIDNLDADAANFHYQHTEQGQQAKELGNAPLPQHVVNQQKEEAKRQRAEELKRQRRRRGFFGWFFRLFGK